MVKKQSVVALVSDLKAKRAKIDEVIKLLGTLYGVDGTDEVVQEFEQLAGAVQEKIGHADEDQTGTKGIQDFIADAMTPGKEYATGVLCARIAKEASVHPQSVRDGLRRMCASGTLTRVRRGYYVR